MRLIPALLFCLLPVAASADALSAPHWSMEFKGGRLTPDNDAWATFYGDDRVAHYELGLAYKPFRQIELALNAGYWDDTGDGFAPLHNAQVGEVHHEQAPLHVALLWRAVFSERQWLVPYVGGGWTRIHYRQRVDFQPKVTGSVDGRHYRAGLQLLLDRLDGRNASNLYDLTGVRNTYLFVEWQRSEASRDGVELGGDATLAGLLFEF